MLFGAFGGDGLDRTAATMESMGLTPGMFMAGAAGTAELVGGCCSRWVWLFPWARC